MTAEPSVRGACLRPGPDMCEFRSASFGGRAPTAWKRAVVAVSLAAAVLFAAPARSAEPCPVTLGGVASNIRSARAGNVVEAMRKDAQSELDAIDWKKCGVSRKVEVQASLVKLDSRQERGKLRVEATVSATLHDKKSGAMLAVLQGRAETEDQPTAAADAERGAVSGAVRGAITAIPEAMRRMK
ncbi:MAG: hypothetical protein WKG00_12580 [Polyangiaceae bacterium]